MKHNEQEQISSLSSFITFVRFFLQHCWVLRAILGMQFSIILGLGLLFARIEALPASQGLYFAMITSTSVGYGDITPNTGLGQFISVILGCEGLVSFGLVVALANHAFQLTIELFNKQEQEIH